MQIDHDHEHVCTEFDCVVCGFERIVTRTDRAVCCPDCDESYSIVHLDGFALVNADGWTTRVTTDPRADPISGTAG